MKKSRQTIEMFFAFLLVVVLGVFFFQSLLADGEGKTMALYDATLRNRVALHYVLKNVSNATEYLSEHGRQYFKNRTQVPSQKIIFGETSDLENGAANIVTSIVVDYRGFDTLGEVTVLFISIIGLTMLLYGAAKTRWTEPSLIVRTGARVLFPLIMVFGIYIFVHGHLTPGGGFPGGAVIASAILILLIGLRAFSPGKTTLRIVEGLAGVTYILIGIIGLTARGSFLANFLPTGTVGLLISAGFVALIYITIGVKVGAELSSAVAELKEGEEND